MLKRLVPTACLCWIGLCAAFYYAKVWGLLWGDQAAIVGVPLRGSLLVLIAAQLAGMTATRAIRWHPENWREAIPFQFGVGMGFISYLCLGLAFFHAYSPANARALIYLLIATTGTAWFATVVVRRYRAGILFRIAAATPVASLDRQPGGRRWIAVASAALIMAFIAALAPEIEPDALSYHLWFPKLWLARHAQVDLVHEFAALFPMTWELLYGVGLSFGGPISAKLLDFACFPTLAILVYEMTRRYLPGVYPWLSVAYFVTIPTALWEATTANNDLALTLHIALALFALFRYLEYPRLQWVLLAGINAGLAMATKHTGLLCPVFVAVWFFMLAYRNRRRLLPAFRPVALFCGVCLIFPAPWYARSLYASGNPVFPMLYSVFGAKPPERWNQYTDSGMHYALAKAGLPRSFDMIWSLPWNMTMRAALYNGTFGPIFLFILPGLAVARRSLRILPVAGAFTLFFLAVWASPAGAFHLRYLLPVTPFLAVFAAEAHYRLASVLTDRRRQALNAVVCTVLVLNLPPFTHLNETTRVAWSGWFASVLNQVPVDVVFGVEPPEEYLATRVRSYKAWQYINVHLPLNALIMSFTDGDQFYSERQRIGDDTGVTIEAVWKTAPGGETQLFQVFRKLGISHILFDKRRLPQLADLSIGQPVFFQKWLELEYEDRDCSLFRLRETPLTSSN